MRKWWPVMVTLMGLCGAASARADELPESGLIGRGINLDPVELGPYEVVSTGGVAIGLRASVGMQFDWGPRWALRVPVVVGSAFGGTNNNFAEIDIVPGVVYRYRDFVGQRWTPFLGGGVKLGAWGAGPELVSQPVVAPLLRGTPRGLGDLFDDHHHHTSGDGSGDADHFDTGTGAGIELWAGEEWRPNSWFAMTVELTGALVSVDGVGLVAFSESCNLRLSL